ncbi:MAG: type I-C CRISPR-associated protein Cas7/Csd2 [Paenibacillus macerans]|uniref:type I-C CRISPR-associated protein Cas7/Csd2 n=1 Tax=Paenibacillus TaxID=44249 RepID=UPI001F0DE7DB|nr:type I-C CRISPR-associated protein Cas7/Csd2 [Paenibacillus macerans]MDU7474719.1 type I-C CRISPR-associated protein Cas7/Csd2 [Paenibacillus macerans]UMV49134.1 type I-C CRISPR-associated protein Cas7/Csd2 [Paenibacillus macerans]
MSELLKNRYEFVLYYDVENGNPNGDPDAGNMPRIDPQTGHGIVTDVSLKRKVRNYIQYAREGEEGFDIYISEGAVLNNKQKEAYEATGLTTKDNKDDKMTAQAYMCQRFFDIRTFGAVMDTGDFKCGQVRGPVQLCFSKSEDPILPQEVTITRMASTTEKEKASENRTMGRKYVVPYALYRVEGFISAKFAQKTGFTEDDLNIFFEALKLMFDHDHSASRGKMSARKLFVFKHETELGNAPAAVLFDLIKARLLDESVPPREFKHYDVTVDKGNVPSGVELIEML